jgi:hypothetical protein
MIAVRYVIYLISKLFPDCIVLLSIIFINVCIICGVRFRNILLPVHMFIFMSIDCMCSMYIFWGGAYKYLFSSRESSN